MQVWSAKGSSCPESGGPLSFLISTDHTSHYLFLRDLPTTVSHRFPGWVRHFKKQHWKVKVRLYSLFLLKISEIAQTWKVRSRRTPGDGIQKSDGETQAFLPLSHLLMLLDQTTGSREPAVPTEREGGKPCETAPLPIQKRLANQWQQSRQQGFSSRHISIGYLLDSLKCSDLQREETPRNKEMEKDTWEEGASYMEEKKIGVKCMERSRLHECWCRLLFCPFFHFLTI